MLFSNGLSLSLTIDSCPFYIETNDVPLASTVINLTLMLRFRVRVIILSCGSRSHQQEG